MKKNSVQMYLLYAIIGAITVSLIYHLSLQKNSKLCALIPAMPILGFCGLYFIVINNGNINDYLLNLNKYVIISIILFYLILFFNKLIKNIILSTIISTIIWGIIIYFLI